MLPVAYIFFMDDNDEFGLNCFFLCRALAMWFYFDYLRHFTEVSRDHIIIPIVETRTNIAMFAGEYRNDASFFRFCKPFD